MSPPAATGSRAWTCVRPAAKGGSGTCAASTTDLGRSPPQYPSGVQEARPSLAMRVLAGVVLVVAAWVVLKLVIHVAVAVAGVVALALAIAAIVWAVRVL